MNKILIFKGLCLWDAYVAKSLVKLGYQVQTTHILKVPWQHVEEYQPNLTLIGLGTRPEYGWRLFRQLKTYDSELPILVYQVVNVRGVADVTSAVAEALKEAMTKHSWCVAHDDAMTRQCKQPSRLQKEQYNGN